MSFHPYQVAPWKVKTLRIGLFLCRHLRDISFFQSSENFRILLPFQKRQFWFFVHNFIGSRYLRNNAWLLQAEMMRGIELMLQLQGELGCRNSPRWDGWDVGDPVSRIKDLLGQWLTFQLFGITYALWLTKKMLFFLAAANSQFFLEILRRFGR